MKIPKSKFQNPKLMKAFTLIEILIASTLFVTVMLVGTSSFLGTIKVSTRSQVSRDSVQQARFALETMTRELRLARSYQTISSPDCTSNFQFRDTNNQTVTYALDNTNQAVTRNNQALTAKETVRVTWMQICTLGSTSEPGPLTRVQPHLTINLTVEPTQSIASRPETGSPYSLRTTVTLRNFDKYQ